MTVDRQRVRERIYFLHSVYYVPSPDAQQARRRRLGDVIMLEGTAPRTETTTECIVKANRGREFWDIDTMFVDPVRALAAWNELKVDALDWAIVVGADVVGHDGLEPIWLVSLMGGRQIHATQGCDGVLVVAPTVRGLKTCVRRYDRYGPYDLAGAAFDDGFDRRTITNAASLPSDGNTILFVVGYGCQTIRYGRFSKIEQKMQEVVVSGVWRPFARRYVKAPDGVFVRMTREHDAGRRDLALYEALKQSEKAVEEEPEMVDLDDLALEGFSL